MIMKGNFTLKKAFEFAERMHKAQQRERAMLLKLLSDRAEYEDMDSAMLKAVAQRILTAHSNRQAFELRPDEAEALEEFLHANMQDDMVQFLAYCMGDTIEDALQ